MRRLSRSCLQRSVRMPVLALPVAMQWGIRHQSVPPPEAGALPRSVPNKIGVSNLTMISMIEASRTDIPTFVMLFKPNDEAQLAYCDLVVRHVSRINKEYSAKADVFLGIGADAGLVLKLGLVDVNKERTVAEKLRVDIEKDTMPQIFFLRSGEMLDKMVGVVDETHVIESCHAFVDHCLSSVQERGNNPLKKSDELDEHPMSLVAAGNSAFKKQDVAKAKTLFQKALDMSLKFIGPVKKELGFETKTPTEEMNRKLRKHGVYLAAPQALAGLAMTEMVAENHSVASALVERIRQEYPFAIADLGDVAAAVARVEIPLLADYMIEANSTVKTNKKEPITDDGAHFYKRQLRVAADNYLNLRFAMGAMDVLVRLIRSEPKLLPELKAAGVVPQDTILQGVRCTPARKILILIFDALDKTHPDAVAEYRRKVQPFL